MGQLSTRRPLGRVAATIAVAGAMVLGSLGWAGTGGAQTGETFLTSDYGTGLSQSGEDWRGWGFELKEGTTIYSLIGGGELDGATDVAYLGAIWEGTYDAGSDILTFGTLLASVTFPEGPEQSVDLPTPVNLVAGQLYIFGMGLSGTSTCGPCDPDMYRVEDFDSSTITGPSELFSSWLSPSDTDAISFADAADARGPASQYNGGSLVVGESDSGTRPAIGFGYDPTPPPTTTTTTVAPGPTTTVTPAAVTPKFTG